MGRDLKSRSILNALFPYFTTTMQPLSRIPKYETIADEFGYTISTNDISGVKNEADFIDMVANVVDG